MATQTKTKKSATNAAQSNTTKRTSSARSTTKLHQRDPKVIAVDTAYAFAGLATDAAKRAVETLDVARQLPARVRTTNRSDLEKRVRKARDRFQKRFDRKAAEGRTVTDDLLKSPQMKRVVEQAKTARSQVKGAVTSIRKTATRSLDAGVDAGRKQADTARSQTKAAATSIQKTAEAAVESARELAADAS